MKMEPIVSSETSAIRTQTPGNYPKRNKLQVYTSSNVVRSEGLGWKREDNCVGKNTGNCIQYFLTVGLFTFCTRILRCVVCIVVSCLVCIVVVVLCVLLSSYVYVLYYVCIAVFTLDAGLLARSQYSEGPATGNLDTGFSWFPYVYKQMLRWFPRSQVATTCFSCSPPDLNLLVTNFIFCIHVK